MVRNNSFDSQEDIPQEDNTVKKIIYWAIAAFVVIFFIIIISDSMYTISAGQRGIVLTWNNPADNPVTEGLHFKIPIAQSIVVLDIKTQKYEADASAASKDLQTVTSHVVTNYHLQSDSVSRLYKEIGVDYQARVISPLEQEAVKSTTAKFNAEELITKREEVRLQIKQVLYERLLPRGIIVDEVSITNFDFSPQFNQAIESKVTNEQNALAAKNKLAQVEYEKQQRIAQAEGEAEAIKIQAASINSQGGKDYVQLQAIAKWNGALPSTMIGGSGATPFIDITGLTK